jgi:hypothetical protein
VRHLVIRGFGHRLAGRVGTMRSGRWVVVDANSRSVRGESPIQVSTLELARKTEEGAEG